MPDEGKPENASSLSEQKKQIPVSEAPKKPGGEVGATFETERREKTISKLQEELVTPVVEKYGESELVRRLRTLKGDVEDALKSGKTTIVSVASAASKARSKETLSAPQKEETNFSKNFLLILASFVFIAGGIGVILYGTLGKEEPQTPLEAPTPIIFSEETNILSAGGFDRRKLREELIKLRESTEGRLGSVVSVEISSSTPFGEILISSEEFFNLLDPRTPDSLTRSLEPHFFSGIHIFDGNQWFFIFKTRSYEQTFSGMLQFEKDFKESFGAILKREKDFAFATSSEGVLLLNTFRDSIIANKDVRVVFNNEGKILYLYSFIDRETLMITGNPETLKEIIARSTSPRRTK